MSIPASEAGSLLSSFSVTKAPGMTSSLRFAAAAALEVGETLDVGNVLRGEVSLSFLSFDGAGTSLLLGEKIAGGTFRLGAGETSAGFFSAEGPLLSEAEEPGVPWLNASAAIAAEATSSTSKMIFFVTEIASLLVGWAVPTITLSYPGSRLGTHYFEAPASSTRRPAVD